MISVAWRLTHLLACLITWLSAFAISVYPAKLYTFAVLIFYAVVKHIFVICFRYVDFFFLGLSVSILSEYVKCFLFSIYI